MYSAPKTSRPPPIASPITFSSIRHQSHSSTNIFTMNFEEGSELTNLTSHHQQHQHQHQHHLLDWLEDSVTFLPSFLDEQQYSIPNDITGYEWWNQELDQPHLIHTPAVSATLGNPPTIIKTDSPLPLQAELSKKRKLPTNSSPAQHPRRRATTDTTDGSGGGSREHEGEFEVPKKKATGKGGSSGTGGSKEVRWAEQLLNPCAAAIEAGNLSRVQHLLYVLHELASLSGDANHRLAAHGLSALTQHISSVGGSTGAGMPGATPASSFTSTEPKLFRSALIRFNEVSPWFAFPNALANSSILQAVTTDSVQRPRLLHVVDIGVSHGVQWPTLLEALTRRQGGAPASIRLTVAGSAAPPAPFSVAPAGYDFPSHLLRYAKLIDLNLRIDRAETLGAVSVTADETLVICVQFRAHSLVRGGDGEAFLKAVREMGPDLVVLSEIDGGGEGGLGFAEGFGRRSELLWRFLESTSSAFKGRDCGERRVVEGEAARMLDGAAAAEGRGRWRERMAAAGFREEGFGEEAMEAGRALLRKYDGNWEMRPSPSPSPPPAAEAVGLRWKGQPVSFCSLWKPLENRRIAGKIRC